MGHQLIESDFIRVEVVVSTYVYAGVDVRYLLVVFPGVDKVWYFLCVDFSFSWRGGFGESNDISL